MACEGNGLSDERIGEALIKEVIQEELKELPSAEIPPLTPLDVKTFQERKVVDQLAKMIRIIGDKMKEDPEFQEFDDAIDGMAKCPGSKWERFKAVADKVFTDGITWSNIAVLFYVAGRMAFKLVEAHLPQSVKEILNLTVDFFKKNLLAWIREHGGWISGFSDLAVASVESVTSMSPNGFGFVLIFAAGLVIGSFITWRLTGKT